MTNYLFPSSPGRPCGRRRHRPEPPRLDHQQPIDREVAVPAQFRHPGVSARVRLHVLLRMVSRTPRSRRSANYLGCCASDYSSTATRAAERAVLGSAQLRSTCSRCKVRTRPRPRCVTTTPASGRPGAVGWLVSSAAPTSGICYDATGAPVVGCGAGTQTFTLKQGVNGTVIPPARSMVVFAVPAAASTSSVKTDSLGDVQHGHAAASRRSRSPISGSRPSA